MRWSAETRAELGGEQRAAGVRELLRVDLHAEAQLAPLLQHAARLRHGEGALVAEHVDEIGLAAPAPAASRRTPGRCTRRRGRDTPRAWSARRAACSTRFVGMRDPAGGQHLALILERETVAGLDLERRRAVPQEGVEAGAGEGGQLLLRGRPRGPHRAHDAAAGRLDLQVAGAGQAAAVLAGALAGEDGVRVGVDEAGQHARPFGVDDQGVGGDVQAVADGGLLADPDDAALARGQGAVRDDTRGRRARSS